MEELPLEDAGKFLTQIRKQDHLSKYALAKKINRQITTITRIEDGITSPSIKKLSDVLKDAGYNPIVILRKA